MPCCGGGNETAKLSDEISEGYRLPYIPRKKMKCQLLLPDAKMYQIYSKIRGNRSNKESNAIEDTFISAKLNH